MNRVGILLLVVMIALVIMMDPEPAKRCVQVKKDHQHRRITKIRTILRQIDDPSSTPIIALQDAWDKSKQLRFVMLRLEYGLIISNGDVKKAPQYYLFCRDQKKIVKTQDVKQLLSEINKIPNYSRIDMVGKCGAPFYTEYGVNIDREYKSIMALLKRKRCILVSSLDDDKRHAFFCSCESRYTILDEYKSD